MILDKILKENENKKRANEIEKKMLICRECGKAMQDNSYMNGSRKAGSYNCVCGCSIIF